MTQHIEKGRRVFFYALAIFPDGLCIVPAIPPPAQRCCVCILLLLLHNLPGGLKNLAEYRLILHVQKAVQSSCNLPIQHPEPIPCLFSLRPVNFGPIGSKLLLHVQFSKFRSLILKVAESCQTVTEYTQRISFALCQLIQTQVVSGNFQNLPVAECMGPGLEFFIRNRGEIAGQNVLHILYKQTERISQPSEPGVIFQKNAVALHCLIELLCHIRNGVHMNIQVRKVSILKKPEIKFRFWVVVSVQIQLIYDLASLFCPDSFPLVARRYASQALSTKS